MARSVAVWQARTVQYPLEFADTFNLTLDGARLSRKQAGNLGGGVLSEGFGSGIVLHG